MNEENKCKNCVFIEEEDGFYYCLMKDLYTQVKPEEEACYSFVERK